MRATRPAFRLTAAALVVASALIQGCSPPDLGAAVRTLRVSTKDSERSTAANTVAAALNASACADVAEFAGGQSSLGPYVGMIRAGLSETLSSASEAEKRAAAVRCIAALGPTSDWEALQSAAAFDDDPQVRMAAMEALASVASSEGLAAAAAEILAEETDGEVASHAATALARMPGALDASMAQFEDVSMDTSMQARVAMAASAGGAAWVPPLAKMLGGTHTAAAEAMLAAIGQPALDQLEKMLRSTKYSVRFAAAEALVTMERGIPGSVSRLTAALKKKDLKDIARNYVFFIKLGQPGTEGLMRSALLKHGTKSMALDYLNCGNSKLEKAAHTWASRHGYYVMPGFGSGGGPSWGSGLG